MAPDGDAVRELHEPPRSRQRAARVQRAEVDAAFRALLLGVLEARADADAAVGQSHECVRSPVVYAHCDALHFGERATGEAEHAHTPVGERGDDAVFADTLEAADVMHVRRERVRL